MDNHEYIEQPSPRKRPVFLTVIGILTFVNAGLALLLSLVALMTGPASDSDIEDYLATQMGQVEQMRDAGMNGMAASMQTMVYTIQYKNDSHNLASALDFGVAALAIIGVVFMFRGDKRGFHMYIVSCLLRVGSFYFYIPAAEVSGILIGYYCFTSLLFIFLYSRNLKWMK